MKTKFKNSKQSLIALRAKISESFLSEIISNKKRPSWETAKRLFKVTGIPINVWMGGKTKTIRMHLGGGKNE